MKQLEPDMMPFTRLMGLEVTSQEKHLIVGKISVREELCTTGKIMHGGAVMAMADALGAIGAYLNIPEGAKATTTIESKTNFMRAAPLNSVITGECTPLHIGRRTSVWQTTLRNAEHKTLAIVTQTQMVI
jgi:1,4-dihydroxy-2-naphthoyl-CoA hydrolase